MPDAAISHVSNMFDVVSYLYMSEGVTTSCGYLPRALDMK